MTHQPERVFVVDSSGSTVIVPTSSAGSKAALTVPAAFACFILLEYAMFRILHAPRLALYSGALGFSALAAALVGVIVRRHYQLYPAARRPSFPLQVRSALAMLSERKTIVDAMLRRSVDILVPFAAVALFFSLMQLWLDAGVSKPAAQQTLLWIEQKSIELRSLNQLTSFLLNPNKWIEFAFLLSVTLIALSVPFMASIGRYWKVSSRWLGRAAVVLTLLTSITFFGHQQTGAVEATAARLNEQRDSIRKAYGEAEEAVQSMLIDSAADQAWTLSPVVQTWHDGNQMLEQAQAASKQTRTYEAASADQIDARIRNLRDSLYTRQERPQSNATGDQRSEGKESDRSSRHKEAFGTNNREKPAWSTGKANRIRMDAEQQRAGTNEGRAESTGNAKPKPWKAPVEKFSEALYSDLKKTTLKTAMAQAGFEDELWDLVLDPLLNTPLKEALKKRINELSDSILAGKQSAGDADSKLRQDVSEWVKQAAGSMRSESSGVAARIKEYAARAGEVRSRAEQLWANAAPRPKTTAERSLDGIDFNRGAGSILAGSSGGDFLTEMGDTYQETRGRKDQIIDVYGRVGCSRTQRVREAFASAGATVRFHDIERSSAADWVVRSNRLWLEGESLLPFVRVNGKPIQSNVQGLRKALGAL